MTYGQFMRFARFGADQSREWTIFDEAPPEIETGQSIWTPSGGGGGTPPAGSSSGSSSGPAVVAVGIGLLALWLLR